MDGGNDTSLIKIFIIILTVLCFILFYQIYTLSFITRDNGGGENHMIDLRSLDDPVSRFKHDCGVELIYSVDDYQCSTLCQDPIKFHSKNGACVNSVARNVKESKTTTNNNCDPKSGVLAYIVGDSQFGTVRIQCLSVDPGVQPDDVYEPNKILLGGAVTINYLEKFPTYTDGVCNEQGQVIVSIPNTHTIRSTGVCVPEVFGKMLIY